MEKKTENKVYFYLKQITGCIAVASAILLALFIYMSLGIRDFSVLAPSIIGVLVMFFTSAMVNALAKKKYVDDEDDDDKETEK